MLEFLDPRAEPTAATTAYRLGLGPDLVQRPVRIALLANGFADSATFLHHVELALAAQLPAATFVQVAKPNPSLLVADALFDRVVSECDAVVGAYGH